MIQINLLPDVKIKFMKTKRTERVVVFICGIISAISIVAIVVLYLTVDVFQKNHLNSVATQITSESASIKNDADVNKIITIQQQLKSLPGLYANRNNPYEIFNILQQSTSKGITISTFNINYQTGALTFGGSADNLLDGNVFYNQLLYSTYSLDKGPQEPLFLAYQDQQAHQHHRAPQLTTVLKLLFQLRYLRPGPILQLVFPIKTLPNLL